MPKSIWFAGSSSFIKQISKSFRTIDSPRVDSACIRHKINKPRWLITYPKNPLNILAWSVIKFELLLSLIKWLSKLMGAIGMHQYMLKTGFKEIEEHTRRVLKRKK